MSKKWKLFLLVALIAGSLLRLSYVNDMEYKEDEEINFAASQLDSWPWVGMPSGVYLQNPGMSYWVFTALGKLSGATEPTELANALQAFSILGILLVIPFAVFFLKDNERSPWLWACALALVNPFAVFYQRKLWPEPFLPFFTMLMLMGWWRREKFGWAFLWGLIGACLGQIHMSGFFFAFGFFIWALFFNPRSTRPHWYGWLIGSCIGALPLIPWYLQIRTHPNPGPMFSGFHEAFQLKFWVFWITDPLGLHLGNPLGLLRGQSNFSQISDFIRYPLIAGHATYLCGIAHLVVAGIGALALVRVFSNVWHNVWNRRSRLPQLFLGTDSDTRSAQSAALWGFGLVLTATTVNIRRYYMMVSFPLEFLWIVSGALGPRLLATLWVAELFISANFVGYIHVNEGAVQGDYGPAYHVIRRQNGKN